jgi:hypothetical protein
MTQLEAAPTISRVIFKESSKHRQFIGYGLLAIGYSRSAATRWLSGLWSNASAQSARSV